MAHEKTALLVQRIHDRTENESLDWETTANEEVFQVAFPRYSVQTRKVEYLDEGTGENAEYYALSILNEQGNVIEELSPSDISENFQPWNQANRMLREIYHGARRKALGVEEAVNELLQQLDFEGPEPEEE